MSIADPHDRLQLPETLRGQLHDFRRHVWTIKLVEATAAALFALFVAFLCVFALDRLWDTPAPIRVAVLTLVLCGAALIPWCVHRWIWRQRKPDQLARLLGRKMLLGDHLLGIIELADSETEQARSLTLCKAAVVQVAEDAQGRDFCIAAPSSRHKLWSFLAGFSLLAVLVLAIAVPAAAGNAWGRLLAPWQNTPRYTFAALESLPDQLYVPHGEPFTVSVNLKEGTIWQPAAGEARLGGQRPIQAQLKAGRYEFEFPPQIDPGTMHLKIGDARHGVRIEPTLRPELNSVVADVSLPKYLQRPELQHKDVRGGSISLVKGSSVKFTATAGRPLVSAVVDGQTQAPTGATIASPNTTVNNSRTMEFRWRDEYGLESKEPFVLAITGLDDEPPTLSIENLPRKKVVLDSEQLAFQVRVYDDYGVRRVGMEWTSPEDALIKDPAQGEKILSGGGPDQVDLELRGTFSANSLGIKPQPIYLRIFAEDYLPGRERVYSPSYLLYVLNAEQHAIWVTEQLSKWHRQTLEVRDREMRLFEANKQLRDLSAEELDRPETRKRIEKQAAAERANGRRLRSLASRGEGLVQEAARNPEFGVGHLEKWAEMLQILKDISANRMPTVADLLKEASNSKTMASASPPSEKGPQAGQVRSQAAGAPSKSEKPKGKKPSVPTVVDVESSQQPADEKADDQPPSNSKGGSPKLTLPVTTLMGNGKKGKPCPAGKKMEEAVEKQQDLLAEFERIADELNTILANLEGSTLVKRLKAASREQYKIAGGITEQISGAFGKRPSKIEKPAQKVFSKLSKIEDKSSQKVSLIMDDMHAYFERRRMMKFKSVLDEMREQDVIGALRQLGEDIPKEHGISIAQCEFWSDTLDRWAEDLVDPACCGTCPGGKTPQSLPPSVVLEVLQILEAEINLREDTRVAEQAKPAVEKEKYTTEANKLSQTQKELQDRTEKVTQRIRELPDGEKHFFREIALLTKVGTVMDETVGILAKPETGSPAIAAETEIIELLLQSKRINPKSGGGGSGSSPGGGGGGNTVDSAIALLGKGANEKEHREERDVSQATGDSGPTLPEEFRAGLDEYFNRLEQPRR